ncbi:MAG TPA: hypothetical protein VFN17_02070 [Nitrosarchaeum sp.]|nr:hypothetical protein [Nitrosarchaeum sp.]
MWRLDGTGVKMTPPNILLNVDHYTDCDLCHNPLLHCHCKCPYCGKRDDCECVLFDAITGG